MNALRLKAKDIMTTGVIAASPSMTAREAAAMLADNDIMGAPVVNAVGSLVGVISQTDLMRHERDAAGRTPQYYVDAETRDRTLNVPTSGDVRVKDIMTPIVISADRDDDVLDLAKMMISQRIHRVIIAENNRLYGIVSTMDLLRAFVHLEQGDAASRTPGARRKNAQRPISRSVGRPRSRARRAHARP